MGSIGELPGENLLPRVTDVDWQTDAKARHAWRRKRS